MSHLHAQDTLPRVASATELRSNASQRDVVTHGIATLSELGIMPAVEYLKSNGIGSKVIERVLLEPERRRAPV
jgi:hypothetical protein